MAVSPRLVELLRDVSGEILDAQRPIRILRTISWPDDVERAFFAAKARDLPRPTYRPSADFAASVERFRALKARMTGDNEIERFLRETCDSFATAARMLAAVGTKDFYYHSVELYGRPASVSGDRKKTNLDLARHFADVVARFAGPRTDAADRATLAAADVAPDLERRFRAFFTGHEIRVTLSDAIAAKAVASSDEVRLKRSARFSARDLAQLEFHEGHVHVATALNGRAQPFCPFIGYSSPRTTRTQEGLAVLTEFLTGSTSLERLSRLSDRSLAIQMAEDGADFIQLYLFFVEHGHDESAAFDCARRVCRGGLVEGGAPFTKDVCYLDGLLRATNFLRVALVRGRADLVHLLFTGKIDIDDVPLFGRLSREGLVRQPTFLPAWARDLSYLTAFMSYSAFLGECDLGEERRRYEDRVARAEANL